MLALPACADPEVSVVMVTRGHWELIVRAVSALIAHTRRRFELIIVDNDSDQGTRAQLSGLQNVRLLLNDENRGFGPANNQGAEEARGEHLLLLNTDSFVHPGWLEPLLEALDDPAVGAVAPRYLNPDGSLQEAGALVARDGSVMAYGHGDDPDLPHYRFRRSVDYGSAACMLVRRSSFAHLGGFDERYAPAYFEDVDFCMRLAQHGQSVVYQPRSTVTHVGHGSGDPLEAGRLSERNHQLFFALRGRQLFGRPWTLVNSSEQAVIAARDALATPRVLICGGPEEPAVTRLVGALADGWPRARITWATGPCRTSTFRTNAWLARGVEVVDAHDISFLDSRLFHYDVVVRARGTEPGLLAAVCRTQPQAHRIAIDRRDVEARALRAGLVTVLANAGVAPQRG